MASNYIVNCGKQFNVGNWFVNDIQWTKEKYKKFIGLIGSFKDVFVEELYDYSVNNLCHFTIQTFDEEPVFEVSRLSYEDTDLLERRVNEMLDCGQLEYSNSDWSSPAKPKIINGKLEVCVNYTKLNELTQTFNLHTVPSIPNTLNEISVSNIFSKIVLKDAFHQLGLERNSKERTAFSTDFGHFQFKTFHHGLKNAPRCLQYVMDEVLENVNQDRIKVYQGQVLVHTSGYTEHLDVLKDVLREFRAYNLKVDVEESVFLTDELIFLGKEISAYGVAIDPVKVAKIGAFPMPRNKTDVRSFLGLTGQYTNYVSDYRYLSEPLRDLANSNYGFYWGYQEENAFLVLKNRLISAGPIPLKQRYY